MSYIFVSHASADKATRIRPLVEALIAEGESVWIDRPGVGEGNFGFTEDYIAINDIGHLRNGSRWSESIQSALRMSGAVLGCLSRSVRVENDVLLAEMTIANAMGKLVTCIVDDLDYSELPNLTRGLLDLSQSQAPRIRPEVIADALRYRHSSATPTASELYRMETEIEILRGLIRSIDIVRDEPRALRPQDLTKTAPKIQSVRHGPIVRIEDVPEEIVFALADQLGTAQRASTLIRQGNRLLAAATNDAELLRKLVLREGSLPLMGGGTGDLLWSAAFARAGVQSRRTLLALLYAPAAEWACARSGCIALRDSFVKKITNASEG